MNPQDPTAQGNEQQVTTATTPTARETIEQRYNEMYYGTATDTGAAPVAVATETTSAAPPDPMVAVMAQMQQMATELAALKAQQATAVATASATSTESADWLKLLGDGKRAEGEKAMIEMVKQNLTDIQAGAVERAIAVMSAQNELTSYTNEIRAKNQDILPMEQYITAAVQQRLAAADAFNKPPADYVKSYKEAVDAEVENARKLIQTFRGVGAQQAQVRNQQVLSQPTLQPNAVNQNREQVARPPEEAVEDATSYIAKRQQFKAKGQGLAIA